MRCFFFEIEKLPGLPVSNVSSVACCYLFLRELLEKLLHSLLWKFRNMKLKVLNKASGGHGQACLILVSDGDRAGNRRIGRT